MTSSPARKQILFALRCVLRPIIRILIRAGIRFDEFSELARGAFIESAIRDGLDGSGIPTKERVVLATGVTRQQVDYYIENEAALPVAEPTLARVAAEVLQKWHRDSEYLAADGAPTELEFQAPWGRSFSALVKDVDARVSPGVLLAELLRACAVTCPDETHVRPVSRSLITPGSHPYRIESFGSALARLAETLEYNFNPANAENKRLERFVAIDKGLPNEVVPDFESYAKGRADQLMCDLDDWLAPYSSAASSSFGPRVSTGVHVFLFLDGPSIAEEPLSALVQSRRKPGRLSP